MKQDKNNREERLQEYLDKREDESNVQQFLSESEEQLEELKMIRETDQLMKDLPREHPRKDFVHRVMEHLDDVDMSRAIKLQGILIFAGVLIVLVISGLYIGTMGSEIVSVPEDVNVVGRTISLEGIGQWFDAGMLLKGLMLAAFMLAMLVLDRAVFKPYFDRRRQQLT